MKEEFNEKELDFFLKLESEWRKNQKKTDTYQLAMEYPQAKPLIKKQVLTQISDLKLEIKRLQDSYQHLRDLYEKDRSFSMLELDQILKDLEKYYNEQIDEVQKEIKLLTYQKKFLSSKNNSEEEFRFLTRQKIEQAKHYPIPHLLKIRRDNKILCLKHSEKTPSMHYYKDTNTLFCFSCGAYMDAIDVVMELEKVDFKQAVKKLCN